MNNRTGSVSRYPAKTGKKLWRYRLDADPIEGKRRQISGAGFATRKEANEALQIAIKLVETGAPPNTMPAPQVSRETLGDWVRTWLRDYGPHQCSPLTLQRYHALAGYVLNATEGEPARLAATPLGSVDHAIVEAALYVLLRMPAKRRAHLSPKTVREIAGVLSVSLNKAFRLGKINVNPLLRVELPKVDRTEARRLTPEEIQRLRDVCRGDWTSPFIELSLATGCRRGELLAVTWPDIDWIGRTLSISKSVEQTRAGLRIKRPKNNRSRKFQVGSSVIVALRFQQEQQQEARRLCGSGYHDNGLVFCQPDGSYLLPDLLSQTIARRLKKAGIEGASLHTLRHTHASCLLSSGVPLPAVSARLGHSDTSITARIYSHAMPADDSRAADAWEQVKDVRSESLDPKFTPQARKTVQ